MNLSPRQLEDCANHSHKFDDLRALFLNCTLKRSPEKSHTQGLIDIAAEIMRKNGVAVDIVRPVDCDLAFGVQPDMTKHGWQKDDWPQIYEKVKAAHILVVTTPIWLGEKSSVCAQAIERLYSSSGDLNESGQYAYYGRVGGCLVTGNEDGRQTLRDEHFVFAATSGLLDSAASRRRLAGRSRPRPFVFGRRIGRTRKRFHQSQHDFYGLESDAPRAHDQRRRRHPRARQPALQMGRRLPLRSSQSRISLIA